MPWRRLTHYSFCASIYTQYTLYLKVRLQESPFLQCFQAPLFEWKSHSLLLLDPEKNSIYSVVYTNLSYIVTVLKYLYYDTVHIGIATYIRSLYIYKIMTHMQETHTHLFLHHYDSKTFVSSGNSDRSGTSRKVCTHPLIVTIHIWLFNIM